MAIAAPRFGTEGNDTMTGEILVPQPSGDPVVDPNYWQDELHGLGGNDTLSGWATTTGSMAMRGTTR